MKRTKKTMAVMLCFLLISGGLGVPAAHADVAEPCDVHTYDYDCDTTCNICGYERKATHTYDRYSYNYYYHWLECECGLTQDILAHEYDSNQDLTCAVCGYERHLEHNYNIPSGDSTHHWTECDCGEKQGQEEHSFVQKTDETWHWLECECGTQADVAVHVWGEGQTEGEVTYYTCTICGTQKSVGGTETGGDNEDQTGNNDNAGNTDKTDENAGSDNSGEDGTDTDQKTGGSKVGRVLGIVIGGAVALWGAAIAGYLVYRRRKGSVKRTQVKEPVEKEIKEEPEEEIQVDLDILDRIEQIGEPEEPKDTL